MKNSNGEIPNVLLKTFSDYELDLIQSFQSANKVKNEIDKIKMQLEDVIYTIQVGVENE